MQLSLHQRLCTSIKLQRALLYEKKTVASDTVQEVTKRHLIVPNATNWNSYYDVVARVTENPLVELF